MKTCAPPACASRRRARVSNRPSRNRGEVMPWSSAQMMQAPVSLLGRRQYGRARPAAVAAGGAPGDRDAHDAAAFRVELLRSWKHLNRMLALGCLILGAWLALGGLVAWGAR